MFDYDFFISFIHSFNEQICMSVHKVTGALLEAGDSMASVQGRITVNTESTWTCKVSCLGKVPGGLRAFPNSYI